MATEQEIISQAMAALGRRGAASRNRNLTPEQRSEIASKGGKARWAKLSTASPKVLDSKE